ncbi:peptidase M, neutral zinc metallopeptidase site [Trichormus variabilis]|uniref:Peptidase M, neutral zinc metallopeptidase site n=1 Tax=Trichormus variabilis SAG 1403-4b TaxID=447716 RepID=A0A3S1CJ86_ANAVA|nr:peptidase M, neutral zinc metallopeptidase site [Trichormus variabilis]MBD2626767.1 peptidase M, neutral zinc metallopeptidase site [Trichormus variabilis FACHB-164]RUS93383.1 hypothetical protein DSM107003_44390 [Trichormus variabilis SAG 1403-4b]
MSILDSIKETSQQAEKLAQHKQLREAITVAQTALAVWAQKPAFWERWLGKLFIGNLVDNLEQQLEDWRKQVAQADNLANQAQLILQRDHGDPLETQALSSAIALYHLHNRILHDKQVSLAIQNSQQELEKREQFQVLVKQAQSQAENRFFINALTTYQEAEKLYSTDSIKQAISDIQIQVQQEEIYTSSLEKAKQAVSEGRLRGAIALLDFSLANFPRSDGINLLKKIKSIVQGRELFRQGLAAEKAGYLPAAKSLYENAKSLLPDFTDCQIRLGLVAIKMQDWENALSHLQGLSGQQAAYLRGFALAQQANLQLAYREWQGVFIPAINEQREIIKRIAQHQRLLSLQNIEELVKAENLAAAKIASTEYIQKFGANSVVEVNLHEHIEPSLEAAVWKDSDWTNIATEMNNIWIANPNITTLHNWTVSTYYSAQNNSDKLLDLIIALSTAIANLTTNPTLEDVPWLGNQAVDFTSISVELKRRLEAAIDNIKNTNIEDYEDYLNLRDYYRWELVALRFMGEPANSGMQVNDVFITPGCYQKLSSHWQNIIIYKIHSSQKILRSLYTPWGLAVAACLESDIQRAIEIKPTTPANNEVEQFAHSFIAYYQGCYYLQQQKWQLAILPLQDAKAEIQDNQDWQKEIDRLFSLQRQAILEFSEHLKFAQFWYDIFSSNAARSYLAEYKAEEIRKQLINEEMTAAKALEKLQEIKNIDDSNPVVISMIEKVEFNQDLEKIEQLFHQNRFEEMVSKAKKSRYDRVRYIVAELFIDLLINGIKNDTLTDSEAMLNLGRWAYEICPDEPAFQEIYRSLRLC